MKAYMFTTSTTDIARTNNTPLVNDIDRELFSSLEDFRFSCMLRYLGIKGNHPGAVFVDNGFVITIVLNGVVLYRKAIISIDTTPIELEDDEDFEQE